MDGRKEEGENVEGKKGCGGGKVKTGLLPPVLSSRFSFRLSRSEPLSLPNGVRPRSLVVEKRTLVVFFFSSFAWCFVLFSPGWLSFIY